MASSSPPHRHQSSLEGVIDFSAESPLEIHQRNSARRRFYRIVEHFGAGDATDIDNVPLQYEPPRLVRYTYEYALSDESRDNFLSAFFRAMALPLTGQSIANHDNNDLDDLDNLRPLFFSFASYLLDNFFLPIKASTNRTPQCSPTFHSAGERAVGAQGLVGTPDRLSRLRGACLIRDHHRCVITRRFDWTEANNRIRKDGDNALDDDGTLLDVPFDTLEVAHILPHALMQVDARNNESKQAALAVLNMLDSGVVNLINGTDIDQPHNAITLTIFLHLLFGNFQVFFESQDLQPHTYRIQSFYRRRLMSNPALPVTRTLYLTNDRSIDPPSPRLLAVHRAIAHILHLSAAGDYIDKLLRDMDEQGIQADGSTELDRLIRLRLGGWLDQPEY
ncbi:hypothetical protein F5Y14DRAFT_424437 [Nemania sp. NC0429]|nr:hypothetical protein F5Y14DRAFT_424437 [Nemania sp. NC0429]